MDPELKQLENAALPDARNNGEFHPVLANNFWASGDPNYQLGRIFSSTAALNAAQHNGYINADVDAMLLQARSEIDPAKQKALYDQIQVIATQEVAVAPLWHQQTITAARSYVHGLARHIAYVPTFDTVYLTEH
jgi:ABC-type transport system substrate-binding protein